MNKCLLAAGVGLAMVGMASSACAATSHRPMHPAALLKAQHAAMQPLADMAGVWRGKASMTVRGHHHVITQTERVGPFLNGTVMVMEGRGYDSAGKPVFNALGIISYQPRSKSYTMRAYAKGHAGNFALEQNEHGFSWTVPMGPVKAHYTATIKDGTWHEVGKRVTPDGKSVKFFEMTLKRVGDTDWPAAGAVPFKP